MNWCHLEAKSELNFISCFSEKSKIRLNDDAALGAIRAGTMLVDTIRRELGDKDLRFSSTILTLVSKFEVWCVDFHVLFLSEISPRDHSCVIIFNF